MSSFFHEIEREQDPGLVSLLIDAFHDETGSPCNAGPGEHFLLPGMPGKTTKNLELVREEVGSWRCEGRIVGGSILATVEQGAMWALPKSRRPKLFTSMSECSTIIARTRSHLVVAHVSYSEVESTVGTINFLLSRGVTHTDIFVVASVGPGQEPGFGQKRMSTKADYAELGIPASKIHTFEHSFESVGEDRVHKNLTQAVISESQLFIHSADWHVRKGHWGPNYIRQDGGCSHIINL